MNRRLSLFEGYGVEIEYMIVDRETLSVKPIADRILEAAAGEVVSEVEVGDLAWSNELVLHVIELKTNGPAPRLEGLPQAFHADVRRIDGILEEHGARLLPTAMHPWMVPETETRLWPYEYGPVYHTFDRIFDCRGHGWSNLQSMHLNLPFADDAQFARLHGAIRGLLPLLPALTASSPFVEGKTTGWMDNRLAYYRGNCRRVPSVSGSVVPEPMRSRSQYEDVLLAGIYRDLEALDPEGVLRHEWVNARGAIARFDRHAIEIRVLDVQECPQADLAVAAAIRSVLQAVAGGAWGDTEALEAIPTGRLAEHLLQVAEHADRAVIRDPEWLRALGLPGGEAVAAREAWQGLVERAMPSGRADADPWRTTLATILARGPLARRLVDAVGPSVTREGLRGVYGEVAACLESGQMFGG